MKIMYTCEYYYTSAFRFVKALEILGHEVDVLWGVDLIGNTPRTYNYKHDLLICSCEPYHMAKQWADVPYMVHLVDKGSLREETKDCVDDENKVLNNAIKVIGSTPNWGDVCVYPWVPEEMFPEEVEKKEGTMAYCGGIGGRYRDILQWMEKVPHEMHIYSKARVAGENTYWHGVLGQKELLQDMSQWEFGLAGFGISDDFTDNAMQIKVFDYWASGLSIGYLKGKETSNFIEENGLGQPLFKRVKNVGNREDALLTKEKVKDLEELF